METVCKYGFFLCVALVASVFLAGCFSKTDTTTTMTETGASGDAGDTGGTGDSGGTVTVIETVTTETSYTLDDDDLSGLVAVASSVWDLVSDILEATEDKAICDGHCAMRSRSTLTEESVRDATVKIVMPAFTKYGVFPDPADVAEYIKSGTVPTAEAYANFGSTGKLAEPSE